MLLFSLAPFPLREFLKESIPEHSRERAGSGVSQPLLGRRDKHREEIPRIASTLVFIRPVPLSVSGPLGRHLGQPFNRGD